MNNEQVSSQKQNEEIDLIYFFRPVGNLFSAIGRGIASWFNAIATNFRIVLYCVLLFGLLGFASRFVLNKRYKTDGIFLSRVLTSGISQNIIRDLNKNIGVKENLKVVTQKLNLNEKEAGGIVSIKMKDMSDTLRLNNDDSLATMLRITLIVKDTSLIEKVQKGIIELFENNEYALKRKQIRLDNLIELKKNLDSKIISLDTLKNIVSNSIIPKSQGQGNVFLGEPINPVSVYEREISYFREQLFLNEQIKNINSFEIIRPFTKIYKPNSPDFLLIQLIALGAGLLLGFICAPLMAKKSKVQLNRE
ncbi:MAG TPA: hypothetical protein VFV46_04805 [Lacibacter sp.]|nr:hypothetical protein [Lacibacter sp.]